jgi:hypothetical protein
VNSNCNQACDRQRSRPASQPSDQPKIAQQTGQPPAKPINQLATQSTICSAKHATINAAFDVTKLASTVSVASQHSHLINQ